MIRIDPDRALRVSRPLVYVLCLWPLGLLSWQVFADALGPNPVEQVVHFTGIWTLRLLLVTLAVTPLRRLTGQAWLVRLRRTLGLFTFFYGVLHLLAYLLLDRAMTWDEIIDDIARRPYITVGLLALLLMLALAVTSTRGWVRRLGRRWQRLHRLIYLIGILGVIHFIWLVKADLREPLIYTGVLAVLLASRIQWKARMGVCLAQGRALMVSRRDRAGQLRSRGGGRVDPLPDCD